MNLDAMPDAGFDMTLVAKFKPASESNYETTGWNNPARFNWFNIRSEKVEVNGGHICAFNDYRK